MTATLLNSLLRALLRWGAALVFCLPLRHRPHFWARACGMLLPLLLLAQLLDPLAQSTTLWQQQLLLLVLYVSFFALLGGMIYLCTDINKKGALYCAVWSLLIAQCAYESWCFLELQFTRYGRPLNMASLWAVLVQLLSGAVFFAAVYILLARQLPYKGEYHIGPRQLFSAFFIGILFMVQAAVLDNARAEHTPLSLTVTILIGQFYFITLLYFQSELFKKSAMEKEMNELNLLYERQRQQYQVARQNVQIINKRCHELKVIRRIVQKYKGTLTLEEQGEFFAEKIIFPLQKLVKKTAAAAEIPETEGLRRFSFCGLLDTSACEKLTNIPVRIWQLKTECARKTTDFRTHLAKYGHSDKIMTKNRKQQKITVPQQKQEESDA